MKETFIERATEYPLEHGKLVVYESNTYCKNEAFRFDRHVMTVMLAGHKSVLTEGERFEFFPGTFLIPKKNVIHSVDIPVASEVNPTKCLELDLNSDFVEAYYKSIVEKRNQREIIYQSDHANVKHEFVCNDKKLIDSFERIYHRRLLGSSQANQMVVTLIIKELLLDLFGTEAISLLVRDFNSPQVSSAIKRTTDHIRENIKEKITSKQLSELAGTGLTSFFNKFKKEIGVSPMEYLTKERIKLAKSYIRSGQYSLKEAAFNSGFQSYEHFCVTFKKVEQMTPMAFKKSS